MLVGASYSETNTDGLSIYGQGYTSDDLLQSITSAPTTFTRENYGEYRYSAIFGRLTYNWENKYLVNLDARRDGSSRFGPGKQFGSFGFWWVLHGLFQKRRWIKRRFACLCSVLLNLGGSYGTNR